MISQERPNVPGVPHPCGLQLGDIRRRDLLQWRKMGAGRVATPVLPVGCFCGLRVGAAIRNHQRATQAAAIKALKHAFPTGRLFMVWVSFSNYCNAADCNNVHLSQPSVAPSEHRSHSNFPERRFSAFLRATAGKGCGCSRQLK